MSRDKILHDSWSISAALARGFSDRHFERGEGPGDEVDLEPRHVMQIIGMDILLEGRGRAKSALMRFKPFRFREMGGTSNGPKIRNKISATFRHLNLPSQNAEKVVTPRCEL